MISYGPRRVPGVRVNDVDYMGHPLLGAAQAIRSDNCRINVAANPGGLRHDTDSASTMFSGREGDFL